MNPFHLYKLESFFKYKGDVLRLPDPLDDWPYKDIDDYISKRKLLTKKSDNQILNKSNKFDYLLPSN